MPAPFLQCRVDAETRKRAEVAAADCDMPVGTWLRAVVDGALEAHFDQMDQVEHPSMPGAPGPPPEAVEIPVEMVEPVGPVPRVEHPGEAKPAADPGPPTALSQRDCPHLPQWWRATGRCRCGRSMRGSMRR